MMTEKRMPAAETQRKTETAEFASCRRSEPIDSKRAGISENLRHVLL